MKIGEKIAHLRNMEGLSQEQLAERLEVSRQSVSKWEMNQALPQIDKVLQICEIFDISTDELLRDRIDLISKEPVFPEKNKYFGYRINGSCIGLQGVIFHAKIN